MVNTKTSNNYVTTKNSSPQHNALRSAEGDPRRVRRDESNLRASWRAQPSFHRVDPLEINEEISDKSRGTVNTTHLRF